MDVSDHCQPCKSLVGAVRSRPKRTSATAAQSSEFAKGIANTGCERLSKRMEGGTTFKLRAFHRNSFT